MTPYTFDPSTGLAGWVPILPQSSAPSPMPPAALKCLDHSPLIHLVGCNAVQAEHLSQALRNGGYRIWGVAESAAFRAPCVAVVAESHAAVVMDTVFPECSTGAGSWRNSRRVRRVARQRSAFQCATTCRRGCSGFIKLKRGNDFDQ